MKTLFVLAFFCAHLASAEATALPPAVLNETMAGGPPQLMLNRYLLKRLAEAEARIVATEKTLDTKEKLNAWQQRQHARFVDALGGFPERTPLNAQTVGTVQADGYRVERILFESRPKFFVTAAFFLPDEKTFAPPYPGILIPCGHSKNGKAMDAYQRGAVLCARNGMAAFVYDPIDQGERMQDLDAQGKFKIQGCDGHNKIGLGAELLGWNTATIRIWDGMRALDYLASRPEIDSKKLGCMGNSGGGTLTSYLMALDERLAAASPSCFITTLARVCESIGPQDAEQNIFGQMTFGMDHADFLLMRAPLPVLVSTAEKDFFPLAGAKESMVRALGVATRLGFEDRIVRVENAGPHGWAEPLRVAATKWMSRWLRGKDEILTPPLTDKGISEAAIQVTEHGQVMLIPGARSAYDLMRDELARLEKARKPILNADEFRQRVRQRAGIWPLQELLKPTVEFSGEWKRDWGRIRSLTFEINSGLLLPALVFEPAAAHGDPILFTHGLGKAQTINGAEELARAGRVVLVVDLTGFGETQGCSKCGDFKDAHAGDEPDSVIAYLLGLSLTGMRAEDILSCANWLSMVNGAKRVELKAASWAVTPALHAAALEPELFSALELSERPQTWRHAVETGSRHRFSDVVHGALRDYDLSDLENAARAAIKARDERK